MTDERLFQLLDLWADWMHGAELPEGYAKRSAVALGRYCVGTDFDEMCESMDVQQAEAMDAAIADLPMNERVAVHAVKLCSAWKLRESIDVVYSRACVMLKIGLNVRGIE